MSKSLWFRLRALFRRRVVEREMAAEMQFHLEMETQKNERLGLSRAQARRRTMVAFGGVDRHQESMRDGRGVRLLEDLVRDRRYAARALRHNPGFTLAAVVTLGLAIGTNAAVFSVADGLLTRPFPVRAPDRLVALWNTSATDGLANQLAYDDYVDWRDRSGIFTALAAQTNAPLSLSERGGAEVVWSEIVSSNYFATLGLSPHLGRFFAADLTARPGAAPYAVIGYDLWQRQFAGDRTIVGRVVRVNRQPVEVIGVAPRCARIE
jgi:putative ABC transport system permease protein